MEHNNSSVLLEASSSFNESDPSIGDVITDEMIQEEKLTEKKAIEEENKLKEQMKKNAEIEENCYKRLNLLLSRSSIYAQFMAEKIKRDEIKEIKKQMRTENQKENKGKKRKKVSDDSPRKKPASVSLGNALRNANSESVRLNDESEDKQSSNISEITNLQPALITGGTMHSYQVEGFQWLKTLFENGVNGILADEMGLGKTIQSIAFIAYLIEMGISGPFLICGPLSTVPNWAAEFKRFTPLIPTMIYHGNKDERKIMRNKIMKKVNNGNVSCYPVVITSYSMALIDANFLSHYDWTLLVIDEAHRIKNFQCRLVIELKKLRTTHRMLLTGTPLQNDLSELWSLLNFILPEIFDDLKVFQSWFDISRLTEKGATSEILAKEQEKQIVSIIHQILTPFLLRRTKAEVTLKLPEKKELIVHAPLTKLQGEYYTAVLNKTIEATVRGTSNGGNYFNIPSVDVNAERPRRNKKADFKKIYSQLSHEFKDDDTEDLSDEDITNSDKCVTVDTNQGFYEKLAKINLQTRNTSMLLRQICNHPYLVSFPYDQNTGGPKIDEDLISSSGKLLVLDAMLPELKKRGHKILLFSQFVVMLNIFQDYCEYRSHKFNILHGSMSLEERQKEMDDFNKSDDSFIFLISTKAGGLGLNLATADTVIIYDSDWNPQADLQAQDRCHRIGQKKPVVVYRLVVPNTVDEHMINRATAKRKLEKVIIKKGRFNSSDASNKKEQLSIQELLELLQASDFNGFVKTDDNCVLSADELNKILDRSDMIECD